MRFLLRWISNALAFYLALYLVDSLIAPRFFVGAVWVAILLGLLLGVLNSVARPLHRVRAKPASGLGCGRDHRDRQRLCHPVVHVGRRAPVGHRIPVGAGHGPLSDAPGVAHQLAHRLQAAQGAQRDHP